MNNKESGDGEGWITRISVAETTDKRNNRRDGNGEDRYGDEEERITSE